MTHNGEADEMDTGDHTADYAKLIEYGINPKVASELDNIYKSGRCNGILALHEIVILLNILNSLEICYAHFSYPSKY